MTRATTGRRRWLLAAGRSGAGAWAAGSRLAQQSGRGALAALAAEAAATAAAAATTSAPAAAATAAAGTAANAVRRRPLRFPDDFGAHPSTRIEWWYVTGALAVGAAGAVPDVCGFQITFFRSRTGVPADHPSRFAASQLVFAHAALTDLSAGRLHHDQRIARAGFGIAQAAAGDTSLALRGWQLARAGTAAANPSAPTAPERSRYTAKIDSDSAGFAFDFTFDTTQPVLLQGDAGYSRKGPWTGDPAAAASHYYSQPQIAVRGLLRRQGRGQPEPVRGSAWLDHEWSDSVLDPQAVGWDWIGINLDDGGALTAFRLRRADGSTLWAGGSFRAGGAAAAAPPLDFAADAVRFTPGRVWQSAATQARYPVEWTVDTPAGRFSVRSLLDNQELDSRASTGSVYWEGLSELLDAGGHLIGRGYLEMTGYAGVLAM